MDLKMSREQYEAELKFLSKEELLKEQESNELVIKRNEAFFKRRIAERRRTYIANRLWELNHNKKY